MKVKDESEWQLQLSEFAADPDPDMSNTMRDFVVYWCELAEAAMRDLPTDSPIMALRVTLRATEEHVTKFSIAFVGMALIIIGTHWEPVGTPDEFFASMTQIEQNLYADVAYVKLAHMQSQAQSFLTSDDLPTETVSEELEL